MFRLTQFFQTVTRVLELTEALSDKTAEAEMNVLKSDLQSMLNLISSGPDSSGETKRKFCCCSLATCADVLHQHYRRVSAPLC